MKKNELDPFQDLKKIVAVKPLDYLTLGYYNLFVSLNRVAAYESFVRGIDLTKKTESELKKALVLGLFKVINTGFTVSNSDFKSHLHFFKMHISDDTDKFWYHYYRIELDDLTTDYDEDGHQNFNLYTQQLDSLNLLKDKVKADGIRALIEMINGNFYVK